MLSFSHFQTEYFALQGAKICSVTQFCHCSGSLLSIICGLLFGNTVVLPTPTFDAKKILEAIRQER
jgi:acyl-CoA synthetase (AMP-forming)/AMP-acid ligase II